MIESLKIELGRLEWELKKLENSGRKYSKEYYVTLSKINKIRGQIQNRDGSMMEQKLPEQKEIEDKDNENYGPSF